MYKLICYNAFLFVCFQSQFSYMVPLFNVIIVTPLFSHFTTKFFMLLLLVPGYSHGFEALPVPRNKLFNVKTLLQNQYFCMYCKCLFSQHVIHNINIMHNILIGHINIQIADSAYFTPGVFYLFGLREE